MRLGVPLISCCALTLPLAAQSVSLSGRIAFPLSSSQIGVVALDSGPRGPLIDRGSGVWGGMALDARIARLSATVTGLRGNLDASSGFPDRSGGEISALVRVEPHPAVAFEARHVTRVFSSAAGRRRWTLWGVGVVGTHSLGTPFVRASGALTYLPVVRVSDAVHPSFGISADLALTATFPRAPLVFMAAYRIERFSFPYLSYRGEQFEALTLSLGVRMQRQDGRWTFANRGER